jgi:hypothetical protein
MKEFISMEDVPEEDLKEVLKLLFWTLGLRLKVDEGHFYKEYFIEVEETSPLN